MLHSINMLRLLSCYAIVIFHVTEYVNAHSSRLHLTFRLAEPGFHLFLLISGVILILITKPTDAPHKFMLKRIARIVPLYWLTTAIAVGLALARPWYFSNAIVEPDSIAASFLFLPHANTIGQIQPILYVGWTLGYIMLFYFLFAISLLAAPGRQVPVTLGLLLAVIAGAQLLPQGDYRLFYGDPILFEFAMGCVLGLILRLPAVASWASKTPMWPIALAGVAGLTLAEFLDYDGLLEAATFAPAGAVLVFACAAQDLYRTPLKLGLLNKGGKISYGIFLIHPLLIPAFGVAVFTWLGDGSAGAALLLASVLVLTTALAWLSFRHFELLANSFIRRTFGVDRAMPRSARESSANADIRRRLPSS